MRDEPLEIGWVIATGASGIASIKGTTVMACDGAPIILGVPVSRALLPLFDLANSPKLRHGLAVCRGSDNPSFPCLLPSPPEWVRHIGASARFAK
jgi:hypothetical protein